MDVEELRAQSQELMRCGRSSPVHRHTLARGRAAPVDVHLARLDPAEVLRMYSAFYPAPRRWRSAGARRARLEGEAWCAKLSAVSVSGSRWRWRSFNGRSWLIRRSATTGARPRGATRLHELVQRCDRRLSIILRPLHREAEQLCDRVVVAAPGEVVADGTRPTWCSSRAALHAVDRLLGSVRPGRRCSRLEPRRSGREGEHHRFVTREPAAALWRSATCFGARGLTLTGLRIEAAHVEDVYLELVGPDPESTARSGHRDR